VINRRIFLAGACCVLPQARAFARQEPARFICATPDVDTHAQSWIVTPHGRFPMVGATLDAAKLWRESDGATPNTGLITLNVCFLDGTPTEHAKVRRIAPQWTQGRLGRRVAFRFGVPARSSHIRIRFRGGGSSVSTVGRDNLAKPKSLWTMHLSVVDQRDILHEFGHVLGLKHEHQHAGFIHWNKAVVRRELKAPPASWTDAMIEENIFKHFSKDCACIGDRKPDPLSIMLYPIDPSWTLDGHGTRRNTTISARDRGCLEREYKA
jgi:hypothetical protein